MGLFSGARPEFEDFTLFTGYLKCRINFSRFGWRFAQAQEWLEQKIVEKMTPVMPRKTGKLIRETIDQNNASLGDGWVKTYGMPYGRKLYGGINPKTGIPWHWTNPSTQPFWAEYTIQNYKPELVSGVTRILLLGEKRKK